MCSAPALTRVDHKVVQDEGGGARLVLHSTARVKQGEVACRDAAAQGTRGRRSSWLTTQIPGVMRSTALGTVHTNSANLDLICHRHVTTPQQRSPQAALQRRLRAAGQLMLRAAQCRHAARQLLTQLRLTPQVQLVVWQHALRLLPRDATGQLQGKGAAVGVQRLVSSVHSPGVHHSCVVARSPPPHSA